VNGVSAVHISEVRPPVTMVGFCKKLGSLDGLLPYWLITK